VVGNVGLREGEVPGRRAIENSRHVQHPQHPCARHHDEADKGADLADQQHRLAPDAIRNVPNYRTGDQLARGIHRHKHRRLQRRRMKGLRVERQQQNDERHPEHVHENDEKDGQQ